MPATKHIVSAVSTFVAASIAIAPYNVAFAAPDDAATAEKAEEAAPEEGGEGDQPAEGGEEGGEQPAEGGEEGGEPAEGGEEGGEPAEGGEEGGEPAEGEEGGEEPAEETPEEPAEETPEEPAEEAAAEEAPAEEATEEFYEDDGRPEEPRVAGKAAKGTGLLIAGGITLGLGVAFTTTMALVTRNCSYDGPLQCRLQNQDSLFIPLGVTGMVAGSILVGLGVGFRVRYNRWEKWTPGQEARVTPVVTKRFAGLSYSARF